MQHSGQPPWYLRRGPAKAKCWVGNSCLGYHRVARRDAETVNDQWANLLIDRDEHPALTWDFVPGAIVYVLPGHVDLLPKWQVPIRLHVCDKARRVQHGEEKLCVKEYKDIRLLLHTGKAMSARGTLAGN